LKKRVGKQMETIQQFLQYLGILITEGCEFELKKIENYHAMKEKEALRVRIWDEREDSPPPSPMTSPIIGGDQRKGGHESPAAAKHHQYGDVIIPEGVYEDSWN
jgi:hypothetical protein